MDEPLARSGVPEDRGGSRADVGWIDEGRRRAEVAGMPPPSGGVHGGGSTATLT